MISQLTSLQDLGYSRAAQVEGGGAGLPGLGDLDNGVSEDSRRSKGEHGGGCKHFDLC